MNTQNKKQKNSTLALLCTIVPACIGAAAFRWGTGIWMILPIYPLCVAISSVLSRFFPIKLWLRAAFFPVMTSLLNMMLGESMQDTVVASVIAFVSFVLIEAAVALCMSKRVLQSIGGVALAIMCVVASSLYLGNPFSAVKANNVLREYIETHYDTKTGGHDFGTIRYDYRTGYYTVTACNVKYPTEVCHILAKDWFVIDHYRDLLEDQEMRDEALAITKALRESFGADMFSVVQMGIANFNHTLQSYTVFNENGYAHDMDFCVRMQGKPTVEKLYDAALSYHTVLESSDLEYGQIMYAGGEGLRFRIALIFPSHDNIFDHEIKTTVYVLRHHELYKHLQSNGILECIDRKVKGNISLYE